MLFNTESLLVPLTKHNNVDEDCVKSQQEEQKAILISSSIFLFLTTMLLGLMIYLTIKVSHLVWMNDKIVPIMLACLCMSVISLMLFYIEQMVQYTAVNWTCGTNDSFECIQNISLNLPSFFLANAILLNINKWIYFTMKIFAFIKVGFGVKEQRNNSQGQ